MEEITCTHCGKISAPLSEPPVGGALGLTIQKRICAECWKEWVNQQTLYINHYGLQMADADDRKQLLQIMKTYLGIEL